MQRIENTKFRRARRIQDLEHMGNTIIRFGHSLQVRPEFASLGNEIVVWIDNEKCGHVSDKLHISHVLFFYLSRSRSVEFRRQAAFADAVNAAAFFLTNSCTLSGSRPVSVSTSLDIRS